MPPDERLTWFDEEAGPLVRPYAVTRGRTRATSADLQVVTLVVATGDATGHARRTLDLEHLQILDECRAPVSVAELSATLKLPLSVTKILVSDLAERGLVRFRTAAAVPDSQILQAVIDGIRRL